MVDLRHTAHQLTQATVLQLLHMEVVHLMVDLLPTVLQRNRPTAPQPHHMEDLRHTALHLTQATAHLHRLTK